MIPRGALILAGLVAFPQTAASQQTGAVGGRVIDRETRQALAGVQVTLTGVDSVITTEDGIFVMLEVPVGPRELRLEHIAYGTHRESIIVSPGGEIALEISLSTQAIQLAPLVVETVTELERRRITSGHLINEITVLEIDRAAIEGLTISQLLQNRVPGVNVRRSTSGAICVSYRSVSANDRGGCNALTVVLDGVPISNPSFLDNTIRLADVERVEMLSPGQAGLQYGTLAGHSVLVIETKRGEGPAQGDLSRLLPPFDWSGETEPYPWLHVFGSAFLANAVGVGVGLVLADKCFWTPEEATLFALRTRCRGAGTFAAGVVSVGLPAIGGSWAARRFGSTDRSHGRLVPSAVTAGMVLTGGYLLLIEGNGVSRSTGGLVLALGAPLALTLADRIFRILR